MGWTERVLRVIIAMAVLVLYIAGIISGILAGVLLILSAIIIVTAFTGYCPVYSSFGVNTRNDHD